MYTRTHNVSALRSLLLKISGKFSGVTDKQPTSATPIHTNATFKDKRHSDPEVPSASWNFIQKAEPEFPFPDPELGLQFSQWRESVMSSGVITKDTISSLLSFVLLTLREVSRRVKRRYGRLWRSHLGKKWKKKTKKQHQPAPRSELLWASWAVADCRHCQHHYAQKLPMALLNVALCHLIWI